MHMIFAGFFDDISKERFIKLVPESIEILWEHKKYSYPCTEGIDIFIEHYKPKHLGAIFDKNQMEQMTSYPLIYDITEYHLGNIEKPPPLLELFEKLEKCDIKKMVLIFADEWDRNTLIRSHEINFQNISRKVGGFHSWYEVYEDIIRNEIKLFDYHPLILFIENE